MNIKTAAPFALAALLLAGCESDALHEPTREEIAATASEKAEPEPTTEEPAPTTEEPEPTTEPEPEPEPEPEDSGFETGTFGETYIWEDGIEATVGEPRADYVPSDTAAGGDGYDHFVRFDITVTNGTDQPFDLSLAMVNVMSGSGAGDQVFDTAQGLDGGPMSSILPGRSATWTVGFGVDDPEDVVVEFYPSWEHSEAWFTGEDA